MGKDVLRKIKSLRRKLDKSIVKNGLNSEETREISNEIDELINQYYKEIKEVEFPDTSYMKYFFDKSYQSLKAVTQQLERFPVVEEWNSFAKKNNYLSHISLEYISKLDWKYLKIKVERELNVNI